MNANEVYICPVTDKECEYGLACVLFHCVHDRTKKAEKQTSVCEAQTDDG